MAAMATLWPLRLASRCRVKLDTLVDRNQRWHSTRRPAAAAANISMHAFYHTHRCATNQNVSLGAALVPSKGAAVRGERRSKVVAGAGALSLTSPALCFTVAAVLALLKKANTNLLLAVMALSIPGSWLASCTSGAALWFAFIGLALKTWFASWPPTLDLPLLFVLLGIAAPKQVLVWRVSKWAPLVDLGLCVYLLYQHYVATGLAGMFKGQALLVTAGLATLCVTSVMMCSHLI